MRNLKDDLNHWKENYSDRWLTPDYDDFIELCREADNYVPEAIERALISEEKYLSEEEHRIHWENRAKLAEAEVERLKEELDELKRFYDKVCEGHYDEVAKLQSENAKLRKVVDIAWNVVETKGMSDVLLSELAGRLADWETWKEGEELS